jgi:hypothetical protein
LESETLIDTDEKIREVLKQHAKEVGLATEGAKPMLTLVFCPEKDLQMRKPQNETEELKKEVEDASTSDL